MRIEARSLTARGWDVSVVHGQVAGIDSDLSPLLRSDLFAPGLFATHPSSSTRHAFRELKRWIAVEQPDLCHVHLWSSPLLLLILKTYCPTVVTAHVPVCPNGARFQYTPERLCEHAVGRYCLTVGCRRQGCGTMANRETFGTARFALSLAYAKMSLRAITRCDRVIAPSTWQKDMLVGDGVPADRVVVVPPPIEDIPVSNSASGHAPPVVLVASRLAVIKGVHHAIEASARIDEPHELQIAGDGPDRAWLEHLSHDLGIDQRVRFLGRLAQHELRTAYGNATVVVVSSLWPETFGMVGPEALVAGTPVVAYLSGGIRDWASPSASVTTVETGDVAGLAEAIRLAVLRAGRAPSASEVEALRRRLSPESHVDAVIDLYHEVIAGPSAEANRR
jgi:glycosyltransferase involved in cell wall biosynthesis